MSAVRCAVHDVPIKDATLCPKCTWSLEQDLGDVPALIDELNTTLSRQDCMDSPVGRFDIDPDDDLPLTAKIQALAFNANASSKLSDLHATLVGWVRDIHGEAEGDNWPADNPTSMSRWLLGRINEIRQHPAADQLRDEIAYAVEGARRAVDRPAERIFAGPCLEPIAEVGKCPADLYAIPGRDTVKCRACGAIHDVKQRRAWLLAEAEDRLETAAHISQALSGLGMVVRYDRIRKWRERGRLTPHGTDLDGRDLYRIGDVIELLAADQDKEARRAG